MIASLTTTDGTRIFCKDLGPKDAQPMVFHHGWPLSSADRSNRMLIFRLNGVRVIAHAQRRHGRPDETAAGNALSTSAADVAEPAATLDLRNAARAKPGFGHRPGFPCAAQRPRTRCHKAGVSHPRTCCQKRGFHTPAPPWDIWAEKNGGRGQFQANCWE